MCTTGSRRIGKMVCNTETKNQELVITIKAEAR